MILAQGHLADFDEALDASRDLLALDRVGEAGPAEEVAAPGVTMAFLRDKHIEIAVGFELADPAAEIEKDGFRDGAVGV